MLRIRVQIWLVAGLGIAALAALASLGAPSPEGPGASPASPSSAAEGAARPRVASLPSAAEAAAQRQVSSPALEPGVAPFDSPGADGGGASGREVASAKSATTAPFGGASERGPVPTLVPRQKTREDIALEERARDRARELGFELPPEVSDAIRSQEPLPGEDEPAFAERLRNLEIEAMNDDLLVELMLGFRYGSELYRWGDPTSHHRAEAAQQVAGWTTEMRAQRLEWALRRVKGPAQPRFYPPDQVAPYEGPGAEPPPEGFRWAEPELYRSTLLSSP